MIFYNHLLREARADVITTPHATFPGFRKFSILLNPIFGEIIASLIFLALLFQQKKDDYKLENIEIINLLNF
jgi:hypothetical protein